MILFSLRYGQPRKYTNSLDMVYILGILNNFTNPYSWFPREPGKMIKKLCIFSFSPTKLKCWKNSYSTININEYLMISFMFNNISLNCFKFITIVHLRLYKRSLVKSVFRNKQPKFDYHKHFNFKKCSCVHIFFSITYMYL